MSLSPTSIDALDALRDSFRGQLILPHDPAYLSTCASWNRLLDVERPSVVLEVSCTSDVVQALSFVQAQGLPFTVACGRHSPWSAKTGHVMIHMGGMRGVRVDAAARLVHIQGGALVRQVNEACEPLHLHTVMGSHGNVGCGGFILGGGVGFLTRLLGAAVDQLTEIEIVTHDGSVLVANDSTHSDLFWAAKGAGAGLGIVTRFTMRLHPVGSLQQPNDRGLHDVSASTRLNALTPMVLSGALTYSVHSAASILKILQAKYITPALEGAGPMCDRCLFLNILLLTRNDTPCLVVSFSYFGDCVTGNQQLTQLLGAIGQPLSNSVGAVGYGQLQRSVETILEGGSYNGRILIADALTDQCIAAFLSVVTQARQTRGLTRSVFALTPYGASGALSDRVGNGAFPRAQRLGNWYLFLIVRQEPCEPLIPDTAAADFGVRAKAILDPYCTTEYLNSWNGITQADELYSADDIARLRETKLKYDPHNKFCASRYVTA